MLISVIIAAYNKPFHLERTLSGYRVQTDKEFELIVTEDAESPDIAKTIRRFTEETGIAVTHLTQKDEGFRKTIALNRAIRAASGEYLLFTDDDCIPRNDVVATHRYYARERQYIVGAYNRIPLDVSRRITVEDVLKQRVFSLPWLMRLGYRPTRGFVRMIVPKWFGRIMDLRGPLDPGRFPGCHASCFRQDAVEIGGFNEEMRYGLEDREFGTRLYFNGLRRKRLKNTTYMLSLEHSRPYKNPDEFAQNRKILEETIAQRRINCGYIKG